VVGGAIDSHVNNIGRQSGSAQAKLAATVPVFAKRHKAVAGVRLRRPGQSGISSR
jgi:hypothetical protein